MRLQSVGNESGPALLTLAEASTELRIHERTLQLLEKRGQVRLVRIGRRVFCPRTELDRLTREGAPPQ